MIIDQQNQEICMICLCDFDEQETIPMVVCFQQHLCCKECLSYYQKQNQEKFKCPLCNKSDIPLKEIKRFRHYSNFRNKIQSIKKNYQENPQSQMNQLIFQFNQQTHISKCILSLFQGSINEVNEHLFILINLGIKLLKLKKIKEASKIFKMVIERNPKYDEGEFIGLGSYQESVGFYENRAIQWFQKRYKQRDISVYDLLGLCFLIRPNFPMQNAWYERMIQKHPNNFKLIYGLAVTYHNHDQLDEAEKLYKQIIQMNPKFDKPYEMLGLIYFQRDKQKQYFEYAQKCLQINPNNTYAKCLIAQYKIAHKDSQNLRQQILRIYNQQKEFIRPLYILAVYYMNQMKKMNQAIYYLDKCIEVNNYYYWPHLAKTAILIINGKFEDSIQILENLYKKDSLTKYQRKQCNMLFGCVLNKNKNYMESIHYYNLYFCDEEYQNNLDNFYCLIMSYYWNKQEQVAIGKCNQLMLKHTNNDLVQFKCQQLLICISFLSCKYEEIIKKGLQYQQKYPKWNYLSFYLAKSYYQMGMFEQSEKTIYKLRLLDKCKRSLNRNFINLKRLKKLIKTKRSKV